MSANKMNKICDVCGDKTLCKNFAANACESCKAFFRRTIRKNKTYTCINNGKCTINKLTRIMCKMCRLNRCLAIGMSREFVTSIEENKIRKQMIAENREKHKPNRDNSVVSSPVPTATHVSTHSQQSIESEDFINEIIAKTINISDKEVMQKILDISMNLSANKNNNNKKTNKVNSVPESRELSVIPVVRPLNNPNDWNCLETNRIAELLSATKIFDFQMPDNIVAVNHFRDLARMYHGHIDESIGDIVRFTKNLNGFANICPEDQLSLVKNGCVEVMILREAMYYNNDTDSLSLKMDNNNTIVVKLDVFKWIKPPFYTIFRMFMDKFVRNCRDDSIITDLLTTIILFNPNRPHLKHKHTVKLEQQLYIYLLQRYLLLKYGSECESHSYLLNVLKIATDLNVLSEIQKTYVNGEDFTDLTPYIGPLAREIYELDTSV